MKKQNLLLLLMIVTAFTTTLFLPALTPADEIIIDDEDGIPNGNWFQSTCGRHNTSGGVITGTQLGPGLIRFSGLSPHLEHMRSLHAGRRLRTASQILLGLMRPHILFITFMVVHLYR
jgi:hypothetical protein